VPEIVEDLLVPGERPEILRHQPAQREDLQERTAREQHDQELFAAAAARPRSQAAEPAAPAKPSPVEDLLRQTRPDELAPRDALDLIYRLRALMEQE
jgi:hypothetical protein